MKIRIIIFRIDETIRQHKKDVDQDKDREDVPKLESVEVVLVLFNLVNNSYQQTSKILFTFVPNIRFGQSIAPDLFTMLNTINTEFSSIEVWFTDQNSKQLEIADNFKMISMIGQIL